MKFITLTFDRDHTHAGQAIKRGEVRHDIPQDAADYLIKQRIAHPTPAAARARMTPVDTDIDTASTTTTEETHHELD